MESFSLPGYDVERLLGFGAAGEVWRAREQSSGCLVALKRLRGVGDALAAQRLHREAALLASVRHEHLVRLRSVVVTADGPVLVLEFADGGSLASLLAARGTITAGEVVTIAAPLAQALSDVHARGLTHGDVTPANILFDASGKPLLADLGVASLAGEIRETVGATPGFADPAVLAGGPVTPSSDVHGLAAVCYAALAGSPPYRDGGAPVVPLASLLPAAPAALVAAVDAALDAAPRARPDASEFARALHASCAPVPVRLVAPAMPAISEPTRDVRAALGRPLPIDTPVGRHREPRPATRRGAVGRRVASRKAAGVCAALGALALLAGAVTLGVSWATHERSAAASVPIPSDARAVSPSGSAVAPASASPSSPPAPRGDPQWIKVMSALDEARDRAFADADAGELDGVYLATSPALSADQATIAELVTAGEHARGLAPRLVSVIATSSTPTSVVLKVDDVLPGYDIVATDGTVVHQAGRGERAWTVTLRTEVDGGPWRIDAIVAG